MRGHRVGQRGGNDGLAHHRILGHGPLLNAASTDVIQKQHADFVAGQQLIASVLALDSDAHTVRIGVGGQHQVGAGLFGQFKTQAQRLENFGVGIRAGGEVSVGVLLLGHDGDVGNADIAQNMGDGNQAGTVQRAVNQLETGGFADPGADGAGFNRIVQSVDAVIAHILDDSLFKPLGKGHRFGAGQNVGLLDFRIDHVGGLVGHLAAVGAISLITVILGGIVGSGNHNAGIAVIIAGRKAQRGNRHQSLIDADLHAVGSQNLSGGAGKHIRFNPAVIADRNRLGAALGLDPVGKALGRLADHIHIHPVGAGADDAAQTGGAKFERHSETVLNGGVVILDRLQFRLEVGVVQIGGQPAVEHFFIHFRHHRFLTKHKFWVNSLGYHKYTNLKGSCQSNFLQESGFLHRFLGNWKALFYNSAKIVLPRQAEKAILKVRSVVKEGFIPCMHIS